MRTGGSIGSEQINIATETIATFCQGDKAAGLNLSRISFSRQILYGMFYGSISSNSNAALNIVDSHIFSDHTVASWITIIHIKEIDITAFCTPSNAFNENLIVCIISYG